MKKVTITLTSLAVLLLSAENACADSYKYRPYVGINYMYGYTHANGFKPHNNSLGLRVGSEYSDYFATELFINQSDSDKNHKKTGKVKTSARSYGLDLLAYLPINCAKTFSLAATAGIGEYVVKEKFYPKKHHDERGYGYRFGGGFKYVLTQNWQTGFMARYVKFDHLYGYDHAMEYSLGLEYHFK